MNGLVFRKHASITLVLALLVAVAALAPAACGGSSSGASSATTGGGVSASFSATPSAAATPERLAGGDSVTITQKMVDAARAALHEPTPAKLAGNYDRSSVVEDFCFNVSFKGKVDALRAFGQNLLDYSGVKWTAGYAGHGVTVIEQRWDFTRVGGTLQLVAVATTRGGKVVWEGDYYQGFGNLPEGKPLEPKPLTSPPGPADTAAAADGVALKYALALQAKDAAALGALSAPKIAFMDTASSTVGSSPGDVQKYYAKLFEDALPDTVLTHLRYASGRGWAAVVWTASSLGAGNDGATVLEIRDGRIARETLYYDSTTMPF